MKKLELRPFIRKGQRSRRQMGDANNMTFNSNKFKYVCYTPSDTSAHGYVYLCPKINLIDKVNDIKDLGITMSANCNFDERINNVIKHCSIFQDGF